MDCSGLSMHVAHWKSVVSLVAVPTASLMIL